VTKNLDQLCINTIRTLSIDAVQKANSGHPGAPMALAPAAYTLWMNVMRHNPRNPKWFNRDRFILSNGHASMLLYSMLHLTGYDVPLDEIKSFRQWDSITPGHPENHLTPGVETTTGPLGQGFMNGVGMAMAEAHLAARFNRPDHEIVNHYTYVFCSDGDLMEGASHEAASLAGHLGLGKLIYLYDDNHISIEGETEIAYSDNVRQRFEACHWHVQDIGEKANDVAELQQAFENAQQERDKPSLIIVRTHIGYGSPNKQDTPEVHGSPLGEEEVTLTKKEYDWPTDQQFLIPDDVREHMHQAVSRGERWGIKTSRPSSRPMGRLPRARLQVKLSMHLPTTCRGSSGAAPISRPPPTHSSPIRSISLKGNTIIATLPGAFVSIPCAPVRRAWRCTAACVRLPRPFSYLPITPVRPSGSHP